MTISSELPFNIDILSLTERDLTRMHPVSSLDTFIGLTKNFNPEGLHSVEIFGVPGTPARRQRFSYLDLRSPVIHPTLFEKLIAVRSLYGDIIKRAAHATWNPVLKDFERSNAIDGRTGMDFFLQYLPDIEFPNNDTETRQEAVALLNKYRDKMLMRYLLVIPAGFREYEISEDGREVTDEINEFYAAILSVSNTINPSTLKNSPQAYDAQRSSMQQKVKGLYDLFASMIDGKKNLFLGKFASRRVNNGTRNVLTAMSKRIARLGDQNNATINDTFFGLYQTSRMLAPYTFYALKTRFLHRVFSAPGAPARLCDPETLQSERVFLKPEAYSRWLSEEGLEAQLNQFSEESTRHTPILIEDKYLGLTYRGTDGTFALICGLEELPEGADPKLCTPITMAELLYHALYVEARSYFAIITRYPITGVGSAYPSRVYLKSTISYQLLQERDPDTWEVLGGKYVAMEFPVLGSPFFNAMSPHSFHLARLGADHDGDTGSGTALLSIEARAENEVYLRSKRAYVGTDGRFINSGAIDPVNFVLSNLTGP